MKLMNKKSILLIALAALILVSVGGTLAYLIDDTTPVVNTFEPVTTGTIIDEPDWNNQTKKTVVVKNDGDIPMYVRVAVVGNWKNSAGEIIKPWDGSITLNTVANTVADDGISNGAWQDGGDGYYYFSVPVQPGEKTTNLLAEEITAVPTAEGDYLVIDIVHQAIQSEGLGVTSAKAAFAKLLER